MPKATPEQLMEILAVDLSSYSTDPTDQRQIILAGKDAFVKEKKQSTENKNYTIIAEHIKQLGLVTNLMTNRVETKNWVQLKERDYVSIYLDILKDNPKITKQLVYDYIESDRLPTYHPFEAYFDALTPIQPDGLNSTIFKLFSSLKFENSYIINTLFQNNLQLLLLKYYRVESLLLAL